MRCKNKSLRWNVGSHFLLLCLSFFLSISLSLSLSLIFFLQLNLPTTCLPTDAFLTCLSLTYGGTVLSHRVSAKPAHRKETV